MTTPRPGEPVYTEAGSTYGYVLKVGASSVHLGEAPGAPVAEIVDQGRLCRTKRGSLVLAPA